MEHLVRILETRRGGQQNADVITAWKATVAIVDDFIDKACPFGSNDPDSCKLAITEGPNPQFEFSPYAAVAAHDENLPTDAWEAASDIVIDIIERISGLIVRWDVDAKMFYLSHPIALREEGEALADVAPAINIPVHHGQSGRPGLRSRQPPDDPRKRH